MNFEFIKEKTILDVGCGDGSNAEIFIKEYGLKTTGIDIYKNQKIKDIDGLIFKKAGVYKIPFKDEMFDYVFFT